MGMIKPIRLIELFAGIGAQSKALEVLGVPFESWRVCEWSCNSIVAYNAIHKQDWNDYSQPYSLDDVVRMLNGISWDYSTPMTEEALRKKPEQWLRKVYSSMVAIRDAVPDISKLKGSDLGIVDSDKYHYILTYSYPCQDVSSSGLRAGMEKGSGTRSSLLWEVGRILSELKDSDSLPQTLIMENVPRILSGKNKAVFNEWLRTLSSLGYQTTYAIINATDHCLPQSRKRVFAVSSLDSTTTFADAPIELKHNLRDFLDPEGSVSCDLYLRKEKVIQFLSRWKNADTTIRDTDSSEAYGVTFQCANADYAESGAKREAYLLVSKEPISATVRTSAEKGQAGQWVMLPQSSTKVVEKMHLTDPDGISRTIQATIQRNHARDNIYLASDENGRLLNLKEAVSIFDGVRIRKLACGECMRLMGFQGKDTDSMIAAGLSKGVVYHSAGDSIAVTCLMQVFGAILGLDAEEKQIAYSDALAAECH
jgi:DNA-cytosine methyltransferase